MIARCLLAGLCGAVAFSDDLRRTHERLIRDAIQMAKMSMLRASQEAEIDRAQFRRQIDMREGSHKRLVMQPINFWRWYALAILAEFGLPREAEIAARLDRISRQPKRMARAVSTARREAQAS